MTEDSELVVIWSASLYKQKLCPGLSSYRRGWFGEDAASKGGGNTRERAEWEGVARQTSGAKPFKTSTGPDSADV